MKIIVGGTELSLDDREVIIAKKAINRLFAAMKKGGVRSGHPSLYLTAAVVMYVKSLDVITDVGPENINILADLVRKNSSVLPEEKDR
jgi:hypothetical protein